MYQYLIPGMQGDPASFVANTTLTLGSLDKPLDAVTQVLVDYSAIIPAISSIAGFSFRVKPGGEPQLWITDGQTGTAPSLAFTVSGGIAGRAYELTVTTKLDTGDIRSDVLTLNVLGDGCDCVARPIATSLSYPQGYQLNYVSADGSLYINGAPRFFVSATTPVSAQVLDRWYNVVTGDISDLVTNGLTTWWELSTVGGGGGYGANIVKMNPITPDGVTTLFTLTATDSTLVAIQTSNNLLVSVDGVWQEPVTQFSASSDQIQFTQPPFADSVIFMLWLSPPPDTPPAPGP
jgi:hypothetical protein